MKISIKFVPSDLWIGVYWTVKMWGGWHDEKTDESVCSQMLYVYICLLPMLPIIIMQPLRDHRVPYAHK